MIKYCVLLLSLATILGVTPVFGENMVAPATSDVTITSGAGASASADCVTANNCFSPNSLNVSPGTTVIWTNNDKLSHTITSGKVSDNDSGSLFDSGLVKPRSTFQFTFTTTGTVNYFCTVHPWMVGQVVVGQVIVNQGYSSTYMPPNEKIYGKSTPYVDWTILSDQIEKLKGIDTPYQYPCMNEPSSGSQASQSLPFVDDNSSADFINRTYTSNQDFTTHCDVTLAQHESFQINSVFMVDTYIHKLNNTAFLSENALNVQSDLHQKLMYVTDLIYHNQYSDAIKQLHEIQTDVSGKTSDGKYALDPESQTLVNTMVDNSISTISLGGVTGSQLSSVMTYTTPEYGPIAALVLAIAIISILVVSAKNNLGFTKF